MRRRFAWNRDLLAAVLLCAAAGMADAIGYVETGVFAANMTGNTVLAGLSLAQGDWLQALQRIATLAMFFAGALAGRVALNLSDSRSLVPLGCEAVLLAVASFAAPGSATKILLITFAMGVQATALTRFHGMALSTVVLTSTMGRLAETAADRLMRSAGRKAPRHAMPSRILAWAWVAYGTGAAGAAILLRVFSLPLLMPALVVLVVVVVLYARAPAPRA